MIPTNTKNVLITLLFVVLTLPAFSQAQWNGVRFDEHNTFYKVHAPTSSTVFVTGVEPFNNDHFILRSNDAGTTWDSIPVNTPSDAYYLQDVFFVNANVGFVGGTNNGVQALLKTTDNGDTWSTVTPNTGGAGGITSIFFADVQNGVATDGAECYRTSDGGTSWIASTPSFMIGDLYFIDANNGYATGSNGAGVVMRTVDAGATWNPTALSVVDSLLFVSEMADLDFVDPANGFTYLRNTNKLYTTANGGNSWNMIVVDSVEYIADVDFISATTGQVLSLEGKIFSTNDGGQTWVLEYAADWGLYGPSVYLNSFHFVDQTGFLAGSNGLIKLFSATSTRVDESAFGQGVQVFPNPFSTSVTFKSTLATNSGITQVMICDLTGKAVHQQVLASEMETIQLSLPAGVYGYTVTSGEVSIGSGKLIVQ